MFHAAGTALARLSDGAATQAELAAVLACVVFGLRYARANVAETERENIVRRVKILLTMSSDYSFAAEVLERRGEGLPSPTTEDVAARLGSRSPDDPSGSE
jgi:hypothetical protein